MDWIQKYFYNTMDNLETASNASDLSSNSNLSSLSGLTGYEEELYDLKHLLKGSAGSPHTAKKSTSNDHSQYEVFEDRINKLNTELQNALKLNEKYKNDIYNMERKTELMFHDKFEKLMRHNAQLEAQLACLHNLLGKHKHTENAEHKMTQLERQNFEINAQLRLIENQAAHWKNETESGEIVNNRLKCELEEIKIDICTKNNSIAGLKNKIVDLHVEMQNLTQDNLKVNNSLLVITNELDSYKKSESWYKEQLQQCRLQKAQASESIAQLQALLADKTHKLDAQKADFARLKCQYEELQLFKQVHKLEAVKHNQEPVIVNVEDRSALEMYESTIQSLTRELATIKDAVNEQQASFDDLNKQNSHLIARTTTLQKTLNEKEIALTNSESDRKDLNAKLEILNERLKANERLLMKTINERSEIEVALNAANRDKCEIEQSVNTIRENFTKFVDKYNKIKEELHDEDTTKNKLDEANKNLQKQVENLTITLEKTSSDLGETYRINEKLKSEAMSHLKTNLDLKEQFGAFKQAVIAAKDLEIKQIASRYEDAKHKLESEFRLNQQTIATLNYERDELKKTAAAKDLQIKQIKDKFDSCHQSNKSLRCEVMDLKAELEAIQTSMAALVNNLQAGEIQIHKLKENINNLTSDIAIRNQRLSVAQEMLGRCRSQSDEVEQLNKLLQSENCELKDKLAKFVMNNFNGYNKAHKDKQNELECVLEWIYNNLREIEACRILKPNNELILKRADCSEEIKKSLYEIDRLLVTLSSSMQSINLSNRQLKRKFFNVKNKLLQLEDRCNLLRKRSNEDDDALHRLNETKHIQKEENLEEIKNLKILCKAKELENKERQKRYEVNNRTLLKKVKEHMRGRNSAEKHCNYLQELYNNVFDELNSYKLKESSKEVEIQSLQSMCDNYKNINARMKQEVVKLEKELISIEGNCAGYEALKENMITLESKLAKYESEIRLHMDRLMQKEILIKNLDTEVQGAQLNNTSLQKENKTLQEQTKELNDGLDSAKQEIQKLEEISEKEKATVQELHGKLLHEQKEHSLSALKLENAEKLSVLVQEKNKVLSEEVQALNSKLNQHSKELSNLQAQKDATENNWHQTESHMQTFITNLQSEIQVLQTDLNSVRSDKYFLQRLCSDLKLALQTCMNQSKVLKKHIETLSSESKDYTSLPDPVTNLPSPSKYDDAYINQLLKQSSAPLIEKPLGDLENCLNSLKKEMICLRKQVTENAGYRV